MSLLTPPVRALSQLDDPAFVRVIVSSLLWTVAGFAALTVAVAWGTRSLVATHGGQDWLSWLAGAVTGAGAIALTLYFFVAIATVIATLFVDPVAQAVERRFYPHLPPAHPAPLSQQVWDAAALGVRVLLWQVVGLLLTFVLPGVGAALGWVVAAWAIGRGLFMAVAMRRMDRPQAMALYGHMRVPVITQGALIAAGSLVPIFNLAMPVLGAAAMVHVLQERYRPPR